MPRTLNQFAETSVSPPPTYAAVREVLRPEYRDAEPEVIESILAERFPEVAPQYVEDFTSWLRGAGQTVSQYAPGVVQGAAQGAAAGSVAGPWGALIGALGGGALSALQGPQPGQRPAPGPPLAPAPSPAQPSGSASAGVSGNAAAQLLGLLNNPAVLQAVMSIAMGQAGNPTVQAGGQQIPVGSVLNTLGSLVNRATVDYESESTGDEAAAASAWPAARGFGFSQASAPQPPPYVAARPGALYETDLYDALEATELAYDEALS